MRELRVVGLNSDGTSLVLAATDSAEQFTVPADEELRAAARGDKAQLGQIQLAALHALSPREIQTRIRAGASITDVVNDTGMTTDRVERFAYPVLQERIHIAELAMQAHPVRHDGPAVKTLQESVAQSLLSQGFSYDETAWDAWKSDNGSWIVRLTWTVNETNFHARWRFMPGGHGGTVESLDELADELVDPDASRPMRGLAARPSLVNAATPKVVSPVVTRTGPTQLRAVVPPTPTHPSRWEIITSSIATPTVNPLPTPAVHPAPAPEVSETATPTKDRQSPEKKWVAKTTLAIPDDRDSDQTLFSAPAAESQGTPPIKNSSTENRSRRKAKPKASLPAWEDVLLGVRGNEKDS